MLYRKQTLTGWLVALAVLCLHSTAEVPPRIDIGNYALPNTPANELWFEEPRDIAQVVVRTRDPIPDDIGLSYRRHYWPESRIEDRSQGEAMFLGWIPQDDVFNGEWQNASVLVRPVDNHTVEVSFPPLTAEFPTMKAYDVTFRRTIALRVEGVPLEAIEYLHAFTVSKPERTTVRVRFNAGGSTPSSYFRLQTYNAQIEAIHDDAGSSLSIDDQLPISDVDGGYSLVLRHMEPAHPYCWDEGLLTFLFENDACTISLQSLIDDGPIWSPDYALFISREDDSISFQQYRESVEGQKTIAAQVTEHPEHSYSRAYAGQPRSHKVPYFVGVALNRQRFRVEPNGDIWVYPRNVQWVPGRDTARIHMAAVTHFRFGLQNWVQQARYTDPEPANILNLSVRNGDLVLHQKVFAAPLFARVPGGTGASDDPTVALARFQMRNDGQFDLLAELPLHIDQEDNEHLAVPPDVLRVEQVDTTTYFVYGPEGDGTEAAYLRCAIETDMRVETTPDGITLSATLTPSGACNVLLKIPHIALEADEEFHALTALDFTSAYDDCTRYWRAAGEASAQMKTPEPHLNALYASHFSHVQVTDFEMPDGSGLINTSVGTSVYGNFSNESCMIVHELDERGQHEQARRRLELWVKYQGTKPQPGNFTDYDGMYFGAGGFEHGNYNQHHAWVLWAMCEHLAFTGDDAWFRSVAGSVIDAADWVFRQRQNTMGELPHSRGWEHGFLPAGSLEDVEDFHYWLSTNALMWRGVNSAAIALAAIQHPQAERVRAEADAYRADLIAGFETMRKHTPLVRLRDGRWVPNYPSKLYHRGRQVGWIRETLEGSIYLLLSGLYDSGGKEAQWILDDFQDNRYCVEPYGYDIPVFDANWFSRAGISMQPNLLAGLLPYLERDEPELYLWMFYNAWCACYHEDVNAMVEHPMPRLGFTNRVVFKTSDEANACAWLRYMMVYTHDDVLHFGRAVPRAWFAQDQPFSLERAATPFGPVSVNYQPQSNSSSITATVSMALRTMPARTLVRFRHPSAAPIQSVRVNGAPHSAFDAQRGDVDISGMQGEIMVEASY